MTPALLLAVALAAPADGPLVRITNDAELDALLDSRKRPLVVHFWALWCAPCIEELPRQVALAKKVKARGADVLFVSADGLEKQARVEAHLKSVGALGVAEHALLASDFDPAVLTKRIDPRWYGALPATFLLDENGVRFRVLGSIDADEEKRLLQALAKTKKRRDPKRPAAQPAR